MSILLRLEAEIKEEMEHLSKLPVGTEQYKTTVDSIAKLMDKRNDILKLEFDQKEQVAKREAEYDIKRIDQEQEAKKHRSDKVIEWAKIGTGVAVPLFGLFVILKWEETGTITTSLRGYVQNFIPKKLF